MHSWINKNTVCEMNWKRSIFFFFFVEEEYFHEQSQIIGSNHGPGDMRLWFESQLKGGRFLAVPQVSHLTAIS